MKKVIKKSPKNASNTKTSPKPKPPRQPNKNVKKLTMNKAIDKPKEVKKQNVKKPVKVAKVNPERPKINVDKPELTSDKIIPAEISKTLPKRRRRLIARKVRDMVKIREARGKKVLNTEITTIVEELLKKQPKSANIKKTNNKTKPKTTKKVKGK